MMPAARAALSARASAARAASVRRRRSAIPATTNSWAVRDAGGKGAGSSPGKCRLGLVDAPEQEHTPDLEMARMCRIQPVTMPLERRPRGTQRLRGPAQVARHEGDLGLGHDTFGASNCFSRAERARRTSQEGLRSHQIAELRHRDAA